MPRLTAVRLATLNHPAALYAVLLAATFAVALVAGYVYAHEPARDNLTVAIDAQGETPAARLISGSVIEVTADRLVIDQSGQQVELQLPDGVPVEELRREGGPLPPGSRVNVGAEETRFGFVLTGIVAVEEPSP